MRKNNQNMKITSLEKLFGEFLVKSINIFYKNEFEPEILRGSVYVYVIIITIILSLQSHTNHYYNE